MSGVERGLQPRTDCTSGYCVNRWTIEATRGSDDLVNYFCVVYTTKYIIHYTLYIYIYVLLHQNQHCSCLGL